MMMMTCWILWMPSGDVDGPGVAACGVLAPVRAMPVYAAIAAHAGMTRCRRRFMKASITSDDCAFVNIQRRPASTSPSRRDADEEVVVGQVVGCMPELRPDRACDAARRGLRRMRIEHVTASDVAFRERELVVGDAVESGQRLGLGRIRRRPLRRIDHVEGPVADDDRPCGYVAETLVLRRDDRADHRREISERGFADADEIADDRIHERDRVAAVADDADPD